MVSVEEHYKKLLAHHYTWTRGGFDSGTLEYKRVIESSGSRTVGAHRPSTLVPGGLSNGGLTKLGSRVVSLDPSEAHLQESRGRSDGREVRAMLGDMRDAGALAAEGPFEASSCMGDTLTHLESFDEVSTLVSDL